MFAGLEFEVSGKNGRISWESYFPRVAKPTRILVGNIWVRTLVSERFRFRNSDNPIFESDKILPKIKLISSAVPLWFY